MSRQESSATEAKVPRLLASPAEHRAARLHSIGATPRVDDVVAPP